MEEKVVEVFVWGMHLREPMTFFTDLLVTIACFYFYWQLQKKQPPTDELKFWKFFFIIMSITTCIAGFAHLLFAYPYGEDLRTLGRLCSGISVLAAEFAAISTLKNTLLKNALRVFSLIKLFGFLLALLIFLSFTMVKLNSVIGFVGIIGGIYVREFYLTKSTKSKMVLYAILISVLAGLVNSFKLSVHQWFTYHDLGHLLMIWASYCIYKGVKN